MSGLIRRNRLVFVVVLALSLPAIWQAPATVLIDLRAPHAVDAVLYGEEARDYFGTDLAVGDINGDGVADLAVGAYLADGPDNVRTGAGEVYVFFGQSPAEWPAEGRPPDITIYGAATGDALGGDDWKEPGHIVVGDLDDDGIGDLVVSAPKFANDGMSRGRAWIIWGRDEWPAVIDLAAIPSELEVTTVSARAQRRDFLGAAMAVGDFDGDGIDDLAMSAPLASGRAGEVYVVFGEGDLRGRAVQIGAIPDGVHVFQVVGAVSGTRLGSYLAFGQWSDDRIDDLAIGSQFADGEAGTVQILFGDDDVRDTTWSLATRPPDWAAIGEAEWDQLGRAMAAGDVNDDGAVDLVVGAPSADGPVGPGTGQVIGIFGPLEKGIVRDLAVQPGDLIIYGPQGGEDQSYLGEAVAIGDFNNDGTDDVLTGARQANGFDTRDRGESGIVYLFYGGPFLEGVFDLAQVPADITLVGANARDFTGYVTAGDLTGDEIDDMVASASDAANASGGLKAGAVYLLFGSETPPTPMPTPTPTASGTPVVTPPATPTATATATVTLTATPTPSERLYLPVLLKNFVSF